MHIHSDAGDPCPRRLFVYNAGFLRQPRLRRILSLAGYKVCLGLPGENDLVGVWGHSPFAHRGEAVAKKRNVPLVRIEDPFLRSLHPGRSGTPPLGLQIDHSGVHFDGRTASDLETHLQTTPFDDGALLDRARNCIFWMQSAHLSKYNAYDTNGPSPAPGYVLVVDQTRGDASVTTCGADRARFVEMLIIAQENNPGARIIIKTHPETIAGYRSGYYDDADITERVTFWDKPISPWTLLNGAVAVYTVSSQMGFEAILAGHKPHVFGQPFYAGWGLSEDQMHFPRRRRILTRPQLFVGAMLQHPVWYDPFRDQLTTLENTLATLEAQARAWREDHRGWIAQGMRLWKRKPLQTFFGKSGKLVFENDATKADALATRGKKRQMIWASKVSENPDITRVEDGFLRSRGLGANLIPPLSLVCDDVGIYYDPSRPSQLETLIINSPTLREDELARAARLRQTLRNARLTKYNLPGSTASLPNGHHILVPGQVEDDASIKLGCASECTNAALLARTRAENPDAVILYKPHPDVEAGLRNGKVDDPLQWADAVLDQSNIADLLDHVNEVWTLTSLTGFEALLRDVSVTTLGMPFYAGWGLTRDLAPVPERRRVYGVSLDGLVHASLIACPRYHDPVSDLPCPVEVIVERLGKDQIPSPGPFNRSLAKLQGVFATHASLWR